LTGEVRAKTRQINFHQISGLDNILQSNKTTIVYLCKDETDRTTYVGKFNVKLWLGAVRFFNFWRKPENSKRILKWINLMNTEFWLNYTIGFEKWNCLVFARTLFIFRRILCELSSLSSATSHTVQKVHIQHTIRLVHTT